MRILKEENDLELTLDNIEFLTITHENNMNLIR